MPFPQCVIYIKCMCLCVCTFLNYVNCYLQGCQCIQFQIAIATQSCIDLNIYKAKKVSPRQLFLAHSQRTSVCHFEVSPHVNTDNFEPYKLNDLIIFSKDVILIIMFFKRFIRLQLPFIIFSLNLRCVHKLNWSIQNN